MFLDTEVFVRFGFRYSSTPLKSLINLIAKGRLRLVITDVVVKEVEARIEKAVRAAVGAPLQDRPEHPTAVHQGVLDARDEYIVKRSHREVRGARHESRA